VERLARRIARFHDVVGLGTPAPFEPAAWRRVCTQPFRDSLDLLGRSGGAAPSAAEVADVASGAERFVREHAERLDVRRLEGRAVDGHGDLHLQHAWFEQDDAEPLVIDCLEFNPDLRRIDAAADVAFAAMDLRYRGRTDLAERFLAVYAAERDDYGLYGVVDYFAAYRAAVRAKVAALAARDEDIEEAQRRASAGSATRHLVLAGELLRPPRRATLALVAGTVGSGKTTLAGWLAERHGGVVVSSDRVRKRLAGLEPAERGSASLYDREARARVYRALLDRARGVLRSGRTVWLDATWARRADRAAAGALAGEEGAAFCVLEATCAPEVARQRLARRAAGGRDASDAGPDRLEGSLAEWEAPEADEAGCWQRIATDRAGWRERAAEVTAGEGPTAARTSTPHS
jgi:predicted kinase